MKVDSPEEKRWLSKNLKINLLILSGSLIFLLAIEFILWIANIPSRRYNYDVSLPFIIENDHRGLDWRGYHTFRDEFCLQRHHIGFLPRILKKIWKRWLISQKILGQYQ